jgi:hypothetical protein
VQVETTTRKLLVEVARTVLRVLGEDVEDKPKAVQPAATPKPAPKPAPTLPLVAAAPPSLVRGTVVRIWTGSMYAVGTVESICRGTPKRVKVRVSRGEGRRGSVHTVEAAKAEVIKGVA